MTRIENVKKGFLHLWLEQLLLPTCPCGWQLACFGLRRICQSSSQRCCLHRLYRHKPTNKVSSITYTLTVRRAILTCSVSRMSSEVIVGSIDGPEHWHTQRVSKVSQKLRTLVQYTVITFRVSRRRRKMYCGHARLCVCLCVCLSVSLSAAACPHYCTEPDVTWGGSGRSCPLVVHYWADSQSVHRLRCYGNITRTLGTSLRPSRDITR